ncbi:MAG: hypothetical protein D3925_15265, partial [Candidatus Electrothrix sp. AR5]|nr:hypothetical protein [Candidatus Electrothrix sp. AR5]
MTNQFDNKGDGDQNIAQGDGAVGKQTNIFLQPRAVALAAVLLAGIGWGGYSLFAPAGNSASTQGGSSPAAVAGRDVAVNYNTSGVDPELFARYVKELGAAEQVLNGFLTTLLDQEIPRDQWDNKLREIAATHKELLARLANVQSEDPEVVRLKGEAGQAIKA